MKLTDLVVEKMMEKEAAMIPTLAKALKAGIVKGGKIGGDDLINLARKSVTNASRRADNIVIASKFNNLDDLIRVGDKVSPHKLKRAQQLLRAAGNRENAIRTALSYSTDFSNTANLYNQQLAGQRLLKGIRSAGSKTSKPVASTNLKQALKLNQATTANSKLQQAFNSLKSNYEALNTAAKGRIGALQNEIADAVGQTKKVAGKAAQSGREATKLRGVASEAASNAAKQAGKDSNTIKNLQGVVASENAGRKAAESSLKDMTGKYNKMQGMYDDAVKYGEEQVRNLQGQNAAALKDLTRQRLYKKLAMAGIPVTGLAGWGVGITDKGDPDFDFS